MATTDIQTFYGDVEILSNLTVNANTLHIDTSSGRVGIGKTNPGFSLDVEGIINFTDVFVNDTEYQGSLWTTLNGNAHYTSGNIGIGTNNPINSVDVLGEVRVSNVSNSATVYVDLYSGTVVGTTTSGNWDKVGASDAANNDYFGHSVAISNDGKTAVIGAYGDATLRGAAYVFAKVDNQLYRETWVEVAKLTASDGASNDEFGRRNIAISGDGSRIVVGAANESSSRGKIYVFDRPAIGVWSTTSTSTQLTATDGVAGDYFGYSVAISTDGNTIVAGAYGDDDGGSASGSIYIFYWNGSGWTQVKKVASDDATNDRFGHNVSVSSDGGVVVVGAYQESTNAGAAYIFTRSGDVWTQRLKLSSPDPATSRFGVSVCVSADGGTIIVGSDQAEGTVGFQYGAAYVYVGSGSSWTQQAKLVKPGTRVDLEHFGYSVSLSSDGNRAIVGAYGNTSNEGIAYVYIRIGTSWGGSRTITLSGGIAGDYFGNDVSISGDGNIVLVGAPNDEDAPAVDTGSAVFYNTRIVKNLLYLEKDVTFQDSYVTFTTFTGQHICFPCENMKQGLIVSANKNKYMNVNGQLVTGSRAIQSSESLPVVSLSNTVCDRNVFGVVDSFESRGTNTRKYDNIAVTVEGFKELGDDRVIVNSIGEGALWVVNTNGNLETGDYITTSNISGYGQKQDSDTLKNYTVAKITMDCDFNPQNIPVQVIKKDENGLNALDEYGRLQWEDTDQTQPAYNTQYLDISGIITDQANAIWKAAYVGCTYHCG